jgi:tetrahydromethanopterin S-methyltransferase subunit E
MIKRAAIAVIVFLLSLLVAVILLVAVGWQWAIAAAVAGFVVAGILQVRNVKKFADDPFGDPFFKKGLKAPGFDNHSDDRL